MATLAAAPLLSAWPALAQGTAMVARPDGGFRFLPGGPVFAGGAVAESGFAIVHALLARWLPLEQGYALVKRHLESAGRPMQALCGMQLRLPRQLSPQEFIAFNAPYIDRLQHWGVLHEKLNPVSRTNVAPAANAPEQASLHAFSFTVPYAGTMKTFTMSGMTERGPGGRIIAEGDDSPAGMQQKFGYVAGAVTERIAELGFQWDDATHVELYSGSEIPGVFASLAGRAPGAVRRGIRWHHGRPPVVGLELEMEARAVLREESVQA